MAFVVSVRRLDIDTGDDARVVVLRGHDAAAFGINPGDRLSLLYRGRTFIVVADITHHSIRHGEIGLFAEVWKLLKAKDGDPISISLVSRPPSVAAIKKKLLGHRLTEEEIRTIINDITAHRLSPVETSYFVASGYVKPYPLQEIVWMVKAMAETGEQFRWGNRHVVDKHSVGGLAGNRTTMVAIPIIASLGLTIPKTSSRAITSPAGTADTMEVLAPVTFSGDDVRRIVHKTNGCLIWGGGLSIAPADDIIIRVLRPLSLEPYDKMIVSIMAKKVAMGINYLVIDMPYGPNTKIKHLSTARQLAKKFEHVGRAFGIHVRVRFDSAHEPVGQGIGPVMEARDVVRVLQQKEARPRDLEEKAIQLTAELLEMSGACPKHKGELYARHQLQSGRAWKKMQEIIAAQGGRGQIDADHLLTGAVVKTINATVSGVVRSIDNRAIDDLVRSLGAPDHKLAGLYLHHKIGSRVQRGQPLFDLSSYSRERLTLAAQSLRLQPILHIGR